MVRYLFTSFRLLVFMILLLGLGYTAVVTGVTQVAFPYQANGSLVKSHGKVIGSTLIGQSFTSPRFFIGRPSATSPAYNAASSTASNYGPTNPALVKEVKTNIAKVLKQNPGIKKSQIPLSLVESSASGLDPDITPASAYLQVARVARVNHLSKSQVNNLVKSHIRGRFLGIFGNSYVNVLRLNMALVKMTHHP